MNELVHNLHTPVGSSVLLQVLVSAFLAILFIQSGIDKVIDWRGNLGWLQGHFAKSMLSRPVALLLGILTLLELSAGLLSGIGCILLLVGRGTGFAFYGACVSALALLALFFGQRIAKEYAGAAVLVPYFLLTLFALYILS